MVPRIAVPYMENKVGKNKATCVYPLVTSNFMFCLDKSSTLHPLYSNCVPFPYFIQNEMLLNTKQGYWARVQKGTVSNMFIYTVMLSPILWLQCSLLHHIYSSNQVQRKFPLWSHERDSLPPFWNFPWAWPRASSSYIHLLQWQI